MSFVGVMFLWSLAPHPEFRGAAWAQGPVGIEHVRARAIGSELADEGRGVALRHDGSALLASQVWDAVDPASEAMMSMTEVTRYNANIDDPPAWLMQFRPITLESYCRPRALISAPTSIAGPQGPVAYVAGRWKGWVDFGDGVPQPSPNGRPVSFVAAFADTPPYRSGLLLMGVSEADSNGALCLAAGERYPSCDPEAQTYGLTDAAVVVGGSFSGALSAAFGGPSPPLLVLTSTGGEDGYVLFLDPVGLYVADTLQGHRSFAITGSGDQRVTAAAVEPRSGDLLVAGWCEGPTDLDPDPTVIDGPVTISGRAMFFARYGRMAPGAPAVLRWWHAVDRLGDDEATGIAVSVDEDSALNDLIIIAGTVGDSSAGPGGPYLAAIRQPVTLNRGLEHIKMWEAFMPGYGDDRLHALAVDGLGRIHIAGRFGCPATVPPTSCSSPYPLDFDPHPTHNVTLEPQGTDAFVARYHPWGQAIGGAAYARLDWVYRLGAAWNEGIYAIATDPASTGRVATAGFFGGIGPRGYSIDADPGQGTEWIYSEGDADSFLAVLQPVVPQVRNQVTLVLDNHCSTEGQTWTHVAGEVAAALAAPFDPGNQAAPGVPKDGTVQLNAVASNTMPHEGHMGRPVMPWTTLDEGTAALFGARLRGVGRFPMQINAGQIGNVVSEGLHAAALSQPRSRASPADVHSGVLAIAGLTSQPTNQPSAVQAGRDACLAFVGSERVYDRTSVLGIGGLPNRFDWLDTAVGPILPGPGPIDARSEGMAAIADENFQGYTRPELIKRLLTRLSFCPSDFNTDRCVRRDSVDGDDALFTTAFHLPNATLYSDWTLDTLRVPTTNTDKFMLGLNALGSGQQTCTTCPPPQLPPP